MANINIIKQSEELNNVEVYLMSKAQNIVLIKNVEDNTEINVNKYMIYEDTNSKGDTVTILAFYDMENKKAYATQSDAFRRAFEDIVEIFGTPVKIVKVSGETKAGRIFQTCSLSDSMIND